MADADGCVADRVPKADFLPRLIIQLSWLSPITSDGDFSGTLS